MRKRVVSFLLVIILLLALFAGCASKSASPVKSTAAKPSQAARDEMGYASQAMEAPKAPEAATSDSPTAITGSGASGISASNAILSERKIIRKANVTVEVDNFDEAYGRINTLILGIGFVAESNISTDRINLKDGQKLVKRGTIVVRVDRDKFDKVMGDVKGLGTVLNETMGTDDVTEKFFDVDSRLNLLRLEEERIMEYLKKLDDPDKIFRTESRLTEIRHEIESLTGTLRKLSDLVELSTITINMNEKIPEDEGSQKPKTYGDRLLGNFLDSIKGVVSFCAELLILIVQMLPVLIMLGFFVLIVLYIYKKIAGKRTKKDARYEDKDSGIKM